MFIMLLSHMEQSVFLIKWDVHYQHLDSKGLVYSISGLRATASLRDVVDWPNNGLYSWLIQFHVVPSDLPFGYSSEYN
jgi:hypothetical protein